MVARDEETVAEVDGPAQVTQGWWPGWQCVRDGHGSQMLPVPRGYLVEMSESLADSQFIGLHGGGPHERDRVSHRG